MSRPMESEVWYPGREIRLKKEDAIHTYRVVELGEDKVVFQTEVGYKETFTYWDLMEIRKGNNKDYKWIGEMKHEV